MKVPARLGPVDAGVVIVGVRLQLRPDGGLHVVSDPIPALQEGIPLAIRTLTVRITRDGFMRNPTSCGEKTALGHFDSLGNEHADISSKLSFTGCDRLELRAEDQSVHRREAPHGRRQPSAVHDRHHLQRRRRHDPQRARAAAEGRRLQHALAQRGLRDRRVRGRQMSDPVAHRECGRAQPAAARPVTGPVYLVKRPAGQKGLPRLVVQFRSPVALQLDGIVNIGKGGGIGTTFPVVPDLPITRFTLRFHGGAYGALALTRNICRRSLHLPATFAGQNGRTVKARPRIAVRGCRGARAHKRAKHRRH